MFFNSEDVTMLLSISCLVFEFQLPTAHAVTYFTDQDIQCSNIYLFLFLFPGRRRGSWGFRIVDNLVNVVYDYMFINEKFD